MAWTTPRDWTGISQDIVTAAMLNVDVRDNLGVLSTHAHTGAAGQGASSMSGPSRPWRPSRSPTSLRIPTLPGSFSATETTCYSTGPAR